MQSKFRTSDDADSTSTVGSIVIWGCEVKAVGCCDEEAIIKSSRGTK
jgi:hypothetical protein